MAHKIGSACYNLGRAILLADKAFPEEIDNFSVSFLKEGPSVKSAWVL